MSSSDEDPLPVEIVITEILKRLPVKSLLRFRCVSRMWHATIDDRRFVALRLSQSALDASSRYLVYRDWCDHVGSLCSLFSDESLALSPDSQIEIPFVTPPNCYGFMGSCNGLIWVTEISKKGYGQTMYLWNLFTRKHRAVRRSCPEHRSRPVEAAHVLLGFGYEARSNDYKIVRILHFPDVRGRCFGGIKPRVEIYSLNTDSWRTLGCEVPAFCNHKPAIFLNGHLHWFIFRLGTPGKKGGRGAIVKFDLRGEAFGEVALLEELLHDAVNSTVSVAVLNDLLAVLINRRDAVLHPELHSVCSVWVMRDYGVPESWTKLWTFEACGLVTGFDGFTRNGELLMDIDGGGRVSWNPITGRFANLPLSTTCDMVSVIESHVSLKI